MFDHKDQFVSKHCDCFNFLKLSIDQGKFELSDVESLLIFSIEIAQERIPRCSRVYHHFHPKEHKQPRQCVDLSQHWLPTWQYS